ncbi:hypothetical protein LXA47_09775, partial [Massilia sp. P8910]|uniref:hypothetical protein n=1 Tax=Massilia antarctica TaxID=2765360 RepID=UPI001E5A6B38
RLRGNDGWGGGRERREKAITQASKKRISHFFAKPLHIPTSSRYNHAPKQDVNEIAESTLQI